MAVAVLVVSVVLMASTYLAGDPLLPDGVGFLLFPVLFPVHLGTVISMIRLSNRGHRRSWSSVGVLLRRLSVVERAALIGLVVVAWALMASRSSGRVACLSSTGAGTSSTRTAS